jgi:hypothetical protein
MKITKLVITGFLGISLLMQGTVQALATEGSEVQTDQYKEIVQNMIDNYDSSEEVKEKVAAEDERFVNEMIIEQEEKHAMIDKKYKEAVDKGEKMYSPEQILKSKAKHFDISEEDMQRIKHSIKTQQEDYENLLAAFKELGQQNHEIAKKIKEEANKKIPKSFIFVDHSVDKKDGIISGGGWPYCLDDNGYSYGNFVTSDCYKAMIAAWICAVDSTLGKMNSSLRYCKAYIRNCSPIIGHSKYNHSHSWWQKIP